MNPLSTFRVVAGRAPDRTAGSLDLTQPLAARFLTP